MITLWKKIVEKFKKYLAPLHPTNKQRVNILLNPHELLQPNYEISFLAGLLSGLSLNLSFLILTVVYPALWDSLEKFVDGTSQNWVVLIISLLILAGTTLVFFICGLVPIVVFGCIPIANSVGLQLQAATVVDNTSISQKHYTRVIRLAVLSLFLSLGFILGCLLSSTAVPLSLAPIPSKFLLVLPKLPVFIVLWGCVFLIWMLPLRGIAGRLYSKHTGDKIPRNKQKFLTFLSTLALFPTFVGSTIIHIILNYRTLCPDSFRYFCPESLSTQDLVFWLVLISLLSLLLQAIVWGVGWIVMKKRGWLQPIHCPNCDTPIHGKMTVNQTCPSCEHPLRQWLQSPSPLSLPLLPPLAISPSENAPPL